MYQIGMAKVQGEWVWQDSAEVLSEVPWARGQPSGEEDEIRGGIVWEEDVKGYVVHDLSIGHPHEAICIKRNC